MPGERIVEVVEFQPGETWPRVALRFAEIDGRAVLVNVEIGAPYLVDEGAVDLTHDEPVPITTSVLRAIPLGRLTEQALWEFARSYAAAASGDPYSRPAGVDHDDARRRYFEERAAAARAGTEARRRPGRPPLYDDDHFAEVARVYRAHSGGRAPTKAVGAHFNVSKATAAKWVARARDKDLLEPHGGRAEDG